jgi:tRNA threonylcarbamoyladenosine biosynthesis protein TsaB
MNKALKLLAIDTATEQCSVALILGEACTTRLVPTARSHAEMILPMIDELLKQSSVSLSDLDGLAFGRGPGSFTGVRIAVSVAQGLALSCDLKVLPISNLAAVAQQEATEQDLPIGTLILVCMDARMREVYWGLFRVAIGVLGDKQVALCDLEHVSAPGDVNIPDSVTVAIGVGTGWDAYPGLHQRLPAVQMGQARLPRAQEIASLARTAIECGEGVKAAEAQPVYLRDNVTHAIK